MRLKTCFSSASVIALLLIAFAPACRAQSAGTSALTGTVTDPTGAVIPGVTVTAVSLAKNLSRTTRTDEVGVYRLALLDPGAYRVTFTFSGFKTAEVSSIVLAVTETSVLNRTLEVGTQAERVTVEAFQEVIQTASSTMGTTVSGDTIASLPLPARNFTSVLGTSAGVAVDATNGVSYGKGSINMSVNGANPEKNNFQMDGVAINNASGNNRAADDGLYTGIAIPNPDAIAEFKIQTSTYDASYGRNPGANVNVVTRSGTNAFHGTLFEFFRNEALNANDFFYNRDRRPGSPDKQVLRQNQFGGSFGGPIQKDKLFFFGSYQGTRQFNGVAPQGVTQATLYPVPGNREATDFQARLGAAMCTFPTRGITIACNGSNINPVAIALLRVKLPDGSYYIPGSGTSGLVQRTFSIPARYSEDQFLANFDWLTTQKHSLSLKTMYSSNPFEYQLNGQLPGRVQSDKRRNASGVIRLTSLLSPTSVNQARVSFQRIIQKGTDTVPYTPQQIGLKPMVDITCCAGTTRGTYTLPPVMNILGAFNIGGGLNPSNSPTTQIQLADEYSHTMGSHAFRGGFEFESVRWPLTFGGLGRGFLIVNSFPDILIGRAGCAPTDLTCTTANPGSTTGSQFSSFNACLFCVRSGVNGIVHNYSLRNMSLFLQDDWTVNSSLTLNLGLRWERFGTLADKYGNLTNFWLSDLQSVPVPPTAPSPADPNGFIGYVVPENYDARPITEGGHGPLPPGVREFDGKFTAENRIPLSNFGPRIGFAWKALDNSRAVVRGGFGIYYDRIGINRLVHAVQEGRPYADTTGLQHDIASLQSPFQDRPLAFLPRWFNPTTLQGSAFNSPFYDHIQTPLIRQYNVGIQYEFMPSYMVEIAYVGSSGINIANYNHVINTAQLGSPSAPINGIVFNTPQNAVARVPYRGFLPNGLQRNAFDGVYNYNSLQTTVRKSFSRGFGFQAAYTWSKNLSNVGYDSANLNNPTDMAQQYGQTPYSRPHRFVVSYQYQLPFTAAGGLKHVVEGWSLSGVTLLQSGNPITFFDSRGGSVYGMLSSGTYENGLSRAQLCPGKTYADIATKGSVKDRLGRTGDATVPRFFDISAFCPPPTIDGGTDFGNTGVGIVRGPGQANFDFSITKVTPVGEGKTLQFRTEFFNLFNHAQFAIPVGTQVGGLAGNQTIYPSNPNLFGVINGTSVNPRLIQLALRLQF